MKPLGRADIAAIARTGKIPAGIPDKTADKLADVMELDIRIAKLEAAREPLGTLPARRARIVDSIAAEAYVALGAAKNKARAEAERAAAMPTRRPSLPPMEPPPDPVALAERYFARRPRGEPVSVTAAFCGDPKVAQRGQAMSHQERYWPAPVVRCCDAPNCFEIAEPGKRLCKAHEVER